MPMLSVSVSSDAIEWLELLAEECGASKSMVVGRIIQSMFTGLSNLRETGANRPSMKVERETESETDLPDVMNISLTETANPLALGISAEEAAKNTKHWLDYITFPEPKTLIPRAECQHINTIREPMPRGSTPDISASVNGFDSYPWKRQYRCLDCGTTKAGKLSDRLTPDD